MTDANVCGNCGSSVTVGSRFCAICGLPVDGVESSHSTRRPSKESISSGEQRILATLREVTLGEYEILGEIGRGGMALVFLAHDISLNRKVAIKVMSPALSLMDPSIQARFKREARTSAALSHPNIIPIYSVKEAGGLVYFVMKYIQGRSLESVIQEAGALPLPAAQTILTQSGSALGYAHRKGVVHRDVKPGNIMLDEDGWVVVSDFGIAKVAEAEALTVTGGVVGTPTYMSPEQGQGLEITGATDQYALGVVAFEMLAGRPPFEGGSMVNLIYEHCHEPPPDLRELRSDCPPELGDAVMRMLAKKPEDRFPNIEDAVAAIGTSAASSDSIRTQLMTFVQGDDTGSLLDKFSTPSQPLTAPTSRTEADAGHATPVTPPPAGGTAGAGGTKNRRWALIGLPTAVVAIAAGWLFLGRPIEEAAQPAEETSIAALEGPSNPPVVELEVTPPTLVLEVGDQSDLTATPKDSAGQPLGAAVEWESRNPSVASVSSGLITAVTAGEASIVARSGNATSTVAVLVTAPSPAASASEPSRPARVVLTPSELNLRVGESASLTATVLGTSGTRLARGVSWNSAQPEVATVSSNGVVTAVSSGTSLVTASTAEVRGAATVLVEAVPVERIRVTPDELTMRAGESTQLRASMLSSGGSPLEGRTPSWSSSNPQVVSVSPMGSVTALSSGTAHIVAEADGITTRVPVTVSAAPATTPPPPTPADPRPVILDRIEEYRRAIESRDLAQVRQAHPTLTAEQEEAWRQFFGNVSDLAADFEIRDLQIMSERAEAEIQATYEFRTNNTQTQTTVLHIVLRRDGPAWRIVTVN